VTGRAFLDIGGFHEPVLLAGVEAETYFSLFPSVYLTDGRFLQKGEKGAMISWEKAVKIARATGAYPKPGAPLLLTTGGAIGFKIREAPLVGVFRYRNAGRLMNEVVITDAQTVRDLSAVFAGAEEVAVPDEAVSLLDMDADDALFGETAPAAPLLAGELSPDEVQEFLKAREAEAPAADAPADWNFILLRLRKGAFSRPAAFIASINRKLEPYGAVAVNWQTAAGESAVVLVVLQTLFNAGIALVSITGVIGVVNTLLISVFRRKSEIGALRSIGAGDGYIRALFFAENLCVAGIAGLCGVAAGALFLRFVNRLQIEIPNEFVASLFGGQVLEVELSAASAVVSLALAVGMGLLASLYPVEEAVRIEPADALRDKR
jgi:hypothetical protein